MRGCKQTLQSDRVWSAAAGDETYDKERDQQTKSAWMKRARFILCDMFEKFREETEKERPRNSWMVSVVVVPYSKKWDHAQIFF